jgi:poly(A) polymerase
MVSVRSFDDDPLRILRAFGFASRFGFTIEASTLRLIKRKVKLLETVSFERIRDELFKVLDRKDAFAYLCRMDALGIIAVLFPEISPMRHMAQGPYHHLDVWKHTLETVKQLERVFIREKKDEDVRCYLQESLSSERSRQALIKLGALFHDVGKPKTFRKEGRKFTFYGHERVGAEISERIAWRLKLSNDEIHALRKMVFWHLRPGYLADNEYISPRAKFRFFRDTAGEAGSVLLLSMGDQRATRGRLTTAQTRRSHERVACQLLREFFKKKHEQPSVRLLTGDDIMAHFKVPPSPLIGEVLREIEEQQAIQKIKTQAEALEVARRVIRKEKPIARGKISGRISAMSMRVGRRK